MDFRNSLLYCQKRQMGFSFRKVFRFGSSLSGSFRPKSPRRKSFRLLFPIHLLLLSLVFFSACERKAPKPPKFEGDFSVWIDKASVAMCRRMQTCYGKIFRTLPTEKRRGLTEKECVKTVLYKKEEKLKRHSPSMQALAVTCYTNILKTPCKKFAEAAFFDPACIQLNLLADEAFKGQKLKLGKLPWEE